MYPILNSIYVTHKLPLRLKIKLKQTIERFSGPNIGFTLGNFMELTSFNIFHVRIFNLRNYYKKFKFLTDELIYCNSFCTCN